MKVLTTHSGGSPLEPPKVFELSEHLINACYCCQAHGQSSVITYKCVSEGTMAKTVRATSPRSSGGIDSRTIYTDPSSQCLGENTQS